MALESSSRKPFLAALEGNPQAPAKLGKTHTYIVSLSHPDQLRYARVLAASFDNLLAAQMLGISDPLPTLRIGIGSDGVNRDLWAPGKPFWSWHVKEIVGWFSAYSEPRWSHPRDIERDVLAGVIRDGDIVAIQNEYTVIGELTMKPVLYFQRAPPLQAGNSIFIFWPRTEPELNCRLEWSTSLVPDLWQPVTPYPQSSDVGQWMSSRSFSAWIEGRPQTWFRLRVVSEP